MSVVEETRTVNGSIADTWAEVSHLGAVEDWHPNVSRAVVLTDNDTGVGASRRVEMYKGDPLVETVVEESAQQFTKVEMTGSSLLKDAFVTIRTRERDSETTDVTFSIEYGVAYGPIGWLIDIVMMRRVFSEVFDTALAGLSYHLETGELVGEGIPEVA